MHSIIRCIVYAHDEEEALSNAKDIFARLCGERGEPFDYYTTFEDEGSSVSGRGRWGNIIPEGCGVVTADSKEGKQLIDDGIKFTEQEFMENISQVRKGLQNLTDEDLFNKEVKSPEAITARELEQPGSLDFSFEPRMIKYFMRKVGESRGPGIYLYDQDGEGIDNPRHLNNVLTKWKCLHEDEGKANPYEELDIFVVPADVHS